MNKKKKNTIKYAIIILCCVAITVGAIFLFQEKVTTTTVVADPDSISPIVCNSTSPTMQSFFQDTANSSLYTIKITYRNGLADKISFVYKGEFSSSGDAKHASSSAHASYNNFMGGLSINSESLPPSFSNADSTTQYSLFGEISSLTNATAQLFYIDADSFNRIDFSSTEEVVQNYKNKNFSCTLNNKS